MWAALLLAVKSLDHHHPHTAAHARVDLETMRIDTLPGFFSPDL
jgi:hypothetical protein